MHQTSNAIRGRHDPDCFASMTHIYMRVCDVYVGYLEALQQRMHQLHTCVYMCMCVYACRAVRTYIHA